MAKIVITLKKVKVRNIPLMQAWQCGKLRTKVIPNKKKQLKRYDWKKEYCWN